MGPAFDILMKLDSSGFVSGARAAAGGAGLFGSAAQKAEGQSNAFKDSLKTLAGFLAGIGLAQLGKQALTLSADYDDALTSINTLVGESQEQISEWRGELLKLGPEVGKGPVELAKALYTITGAGARGAEALDVLKQAAIASSIGLGDTQMVAKAVVATLESYGRENINAAQATETLRNAVREGNLEASELAPALGRVTGLAATMGVEFDELTGFLAKFSKSGGNAAEGVTSLRAVLNTFLDGASSTKEVLKSLGTSLDEVRKSIREKGLSATLVDLFKRIGDNKTALAQLFPSVEALSGALNVIASDSGKDYLEVVGRISILNNDLASTFDMIRKNNPGQALRDLSAIGETLQVSLGDGLARALMEAVGGLGDLEHQQIVAEQIGRELGTVLGLLVDALGFVADHAEIVRGAFEAWVAVQALQWVSGLASTVYGLVGALTAQTTAVVASTDVWTAQLAVNQAQLQVLALEAEATAVLTNTELTSTQVSLELTAIRNQLAIATGRLAAAEVELATATTATTAVTGRAATAGAGFFATGGAMMIGLAAILAAVLAINAAIEAWSETMQREIDSMVAQAARFAKALGDTKKAVALAIASDNQETISKELATQREAYAALTADADKYRQKLAENAAEQKRFTELLQTAEAGAASNIRARIESLKDVGATIQTSLNEATAQANTAAGGIQELFAALQTAGAGAKATAAGVTTLSDVVRDFLKDSNAELMEHAALWKVIGANGSIAGDQIAAAIAAGLDPLGDMTDAWQASLHELALVQAAIDAGLDPLGDMTDAVRAQLTLIVRARVEWVTFAKKVRDVRGETLELLSAVQDLGPQRRTIAGLTSAMRDFEKAQMLAKVAELALSDSFKKTLADVGISFEELMDRIKAGFAAQAGATDPLITEFDDLVVAQERLLAAYDRGPEAVAALNAEQEFSAKLMAQLNGLTDAQRKELEPLITRWLELGRALDIRAAVEDARRAVEDLNAQLAVDPHDFNSLESYRKALEDVRFELEQQRIKESLIDRGAKQEDIDSILEYNRALREGTKILEKKNVETAWQAGVRGMSEALQAGLTDAGTAAIQSWVEIGDSFVENLLESLIEAFLSSALQSAVASAFSGQGGGVWGGLVSAFTGGGGGGGTGWTSWISAIGTAWKAYQSGGKFWATLFGGGTGGVATTAAGAPPYYLANPGVNYAAGTGGPAASSGGSAAGAGSASLWTAGITAAIVYGLQKWYDERTKNDFLGVSQLFFYGQVADPTKPPIPYDPGAGSGTPTGQPGGGGSGGRGGGGYNAKPAYSNAPGDGQYIYPTQGGILTNGGLANNIGQEAVDELRQQVEDLTVGVVKSFGGMVTGLGQFSIDIDKQGKNFQITLKDGSQKIFKTWGEAIEHGVTSMLAEGTFEGLTENIATVLHKANDLGLEGLDKALALAQEADDALGRSLGKTGTAVTLFEQQNADLERQLGDVILEAKKLGLTEESIAALTEQRREQLRLEQDLLGGQALTNLLQGLFEASAAAAGDAQLAAEYTRAVGAIRIAELQKEAIEFAKLGYISAEVFASIQGYIAALDPTKVGERISGGGSWNAPSPPSGGGSSGPDQAAQEEERRAARRAELEQMVADMALGLNGLAAEALQRGRDIKATIEEMNELKMDPALIEQFWQLAKGDAIKALLAQASEVLASAGRSDFEQRRAEMDAFWDEQILAAYQLGAELGVSGEKLAEPIRQAQEEQRRQLAEDAVASLNLPLEQTRQQAKGLTDALEYLKRAQAEGSISAERYADIIAQSQTQAMVTLYGMAASLLEQTGGLKLAADMRAKIAAAQFDIEVAQLEILYQTMLAAGVLSDEAKANIEEALRFIKDPANRPDFTKLVDPPGGGPPTAGNDNQQQQEDLDRLRQSVLDQLQAWRDLGIDPVTKQARDLNEVLRQTREDARRAGVALADVDAAFAVARANFIKQQLAPYEHILDPLGGELEAINAHFEDLAAAFWEIGASAADMARLEEARQNAIIAFYERVDQSAQSLLDRLTGGDLSTGTKREQFEQAQAQFQALAARLAANPQDLEARAAIAAAGERLLQTAQAYNSGALYGEMAQLVQQVLMGLLGGGNVVPFLIPPAPGGGAHDPRVRQGRTRFDSPSFPGFPANDKEPPIGGSTMSPAEQRTNGLLTEIRDALRLLVGVEETGNRDQRELAGAALDHAERMQRRLGDALAGLPSDLSRAIGGRR